MRIQPVPMGLCTSYLIKDRGTVLVDAGQQGYGRSFREGLRALGLAPSDLLLVFLTHGHWDHIGFLSELRREAHCYVAISERERPWVEQGLKPFPPSISLMGWVLGVYLRTIVIPRQTFPGVSVDVALKDEPFSLQGYGVDGTVYPTPGHSLGSMSLILSTGEAFVGDLAMNILRPGKPFWGEDLDLILQSWRALLQAGAKMIYPAHGRPFEASALERLLGQ